HTINRYYLNFIKITSAPITTRTQPQSHNIKTINIQPQPQTITAKGGQIMESRTRQKLIVIFFEGIPVSSSFFKDVTPVKLGIYFFNTKNHLSKEVLWATKKYKILLRQLIFNNLQVFLLKNVILQFKIYKQDRKSTRLNSSHVKISYAVFCLK